MVRNLGFAAVLATLYWIAPLARSLWGFSEPLFSRTVGSSPVATTTSTATSAREIHVDPRGDDKNSGTVDKPVASLLAAQALARTARGAVVVVHGGTYRLERRWEFTPADHEVTFRSAPGEKVVVTSDRLLTLTWRPFRDGIWQADLGRQTYAQPSQPQDAPGQSRLPIDELFVNGERQRMARYPNFDPAIRPFGGFAADAISRQRAARWANPAGGYVHALHPGAWGGVHFLITGKDVEGVPQTAGGLQNNRGSGMHAQHRYVENIWEELDAPGEWFHDKTSSTLYFFPPAGLDLAAATVEFPVSSQLIRLQGSQQQPVKNVQFHGLTFRHAARTFMQTKEPLLRSDWTIAREGAVFLEGTEDCSLIDCEFDQMGGNAVFVSKYNRRVHVVGCDIRDTGASAIAFVGDPSAVRNPLFEYGQRQSLEQLDREPGPQSDNYPAACLVEDCLIRGLGLVEKQAAGVQIAMASAITVRHCSIYDASRAGINIGDGCWGGHLIEHCDVFDTVQETGDHGSFNSWGRDRYWGLRNEPTERLSELAKLDAVKPTILRHNRWRCDHGWDVDLDDGSSNYEITNNVFLHGGLKLREGFHRRVTNNIGVDCGFHPHVWYHQSGQGISNDEVTRNIWAGAHAPAIMPSGKWGREVDFNLFTTSDADRIKFIAHGCDAHSLTGDPLFVNREQGDYRVQDESPALQLGFQNFSMQDFGVQKAALKKIARTPKLPGNEPSQRPAAARPKLALEHFWRGAIVRNLVGDEFSAFGVPKDAGGVHLKTVPQDSPAAADGLQSNDLIQSLNQQPVKNVADLWRLQNAAAGQPLQIQFVRDQKTNQLVIKRYLFMKTESAEAHAFSAIRLEKSQDVSPFAALTTQPATNNESATTLFDGQLARNYGPVFGNGVEGGLYKVDLGRRREIRTIQTWSFQQNGVRGPQHFTLYGSPSETDPGWNTRDRKLFRAVLEVDATSSPADPFQATRIQSSDDESIGSYRWLLWQVHSVTSLGENTAFQEFQVVGLPEK
ncbi:MAG: right-handed parallel beta-helix repeat-containing protein [Planctomycetota bacterium]